MAKITHNSRKDSFQITDYDGFSDGEISQNRSSFQDGNPRSTEWNFYREESNHAYLKNNNVLYRGYCHNNLIISSNADVELSNTKNAFVFIEDSHVEIKKYGGNIRDFLKFSQEEKKKILSFYDWFGNRLMRNRDNISLTFNYRSMEEWKNLFGRYGMEEINSEFIEENCSNLALFPPKAIMVFKKTKNYD